ncbi:unnamed protein product [Didymodactylos carnosus]|uniref:Ionotropic glutamate receptor C-terminal domain-containing protein n=1 Tax=Didymodactylos carnosus TaxID=1234261 RepID=A0A814HWM1_9BILA|nr:unnamed protein product [Didymodactylos carnosus]CAF1017082.1 unnamed protein product [Didymodactylos carnosus]CAF3736547.1 unnamed protein product [Didymodactylos carnosus]CAF3788614.1 unnamed protein product [Didymodactylos carnosus]
MTCKKLRIAVIESPPFVMSEEKTITSNNDTTGIIITDKILLKGFFIDLILTLKKQMKFYDEIQFIHPNTQYDDLIVVSVFDNSLRIVVRRSESIFIELFSYLKPFSFKLWLSVLILILYSNVSIFYFERTTTATNNTDTIRQEPIHRSIAIFFYHSICSVVGTNSDDNFILSSISSKILTISLCMIAFILGATYTAKLSAFLTIERTQQITSIDDIENGRIPYHRIGIVRGSAIHEYYINTISTYFYPLNSSNEIYSNLIEKKIDALWDYALWDYASIGYQVQQRFCSKLMVVGVGFTHSTFGIAFNNHWKYKYELDYQLLTLKATGILKSLEEYWFQYRPPSTTNAYCNSKHNVHNNQSNGITIEIMSGLFLTFYLISLLTILLHLCNQRHKLMQAVINLKTRLNNSRCCRRALS